MREPSRWWGDRARPGHAARLPRTGRIQPAHEFFGLGENDTPSMTGDLEMIEDQLTERPFTRLEAGSRRFSRRNHDNVLPESFREGLQRLFA